MISPELCVLHTDGRREADSLVRLGAAALDARGRSLLEGSGSAKTGGIGDTSAAGGANVANETGPKKKGIWVSRRPWASRAEIREAYKAHAGGVDWPTTKGTRAKRAAYLMNILEVLRLMGEVRKC